MRTVLRLISVAALLAVVASAQLLPPEITKSYDPATIIAGGVTTLTFTVTNPNAASPLSNISFQDELHPSLQFDPQSLKISQCNGGTLITVSWGPPVVINGSTDLPALASCTYTLELTGTVPGTFTNSVTVADTQAGPGNGATAVLTVVPGDVFQVRYVANLNVADALINITNTGANGAMPYGPGFGPAAGNLCVNVYAFSPDEQMVGCCSCHVTPNGLASLSVYNDIRAVTLTGLTPNSMTIKLVGTGTGVNSFGGGANSCTQSAAGIGVTHTLAGGMAAWATTAHVPGLLPVPGAPAPFAITETPFTRATLSQQEITSLNNRCAAIIGNGSTFGTCRSCTVGGRAGDRL